MQRAVNDMEELVLLDKTPLGIEDLPGAKAIAISKGEIIFDRVTFSMAPIRRRFMTTSASPSSRGSASGCSVIRVLARRP